MRHRVGRKYNVLKTQIRALTPKHPGAADAQAGRSMGPGHEAGNKEKETEFRPAVSRGWVLGEWEATTQWAQNFMQGDENVFTVGRCGGCDTLWLH